MTPEQFEVIFENVKTQTSLPAQLRDFIWDLAVQGKLTSTQMRGRKSIEGRNGQFLIPEYWETLLFSRDCDIEGGNQPPKSNFIDTPQPGYTRLIQIRDLGSNPIPVYIPTDTTNRFCSSGDILIGRYGASIGKIFWAFDGAYNVALTKFITNWDKCLPEFAFVLLRSFIFQDVVKNASRTAQAGFNKDDLGNIVFPLPPLEEQKHIVARVDELMTLCDTLENTNQKTNRTKLTYLKSLTKNISDSAINKDKQAILASAFAKAPKNAEGIQELKKVCINFGIQMDQQSDKENKRFFEKLQELTDRMKVNKLLPKSFLIRHLESEMLSTLSNLSLGSIAFIEKGKTGIKSAEPGEYPLVVTAAERKTCKSYDFETDAAIVPLVSSTGHGHASIHRLHFQSGRFALGTILAAVIPFEEELFSSRFIYEYLTTFKEELLVSRMTGTANVTLSVSKIGEVPIPIISSKTQKWICEFCKISDQLAISYQKESSIQDDLLKVFVA